MAEVHAHAPELWHIAPHPQDARLLTTVYNEGALASLGTSGVFVPLPRAPYMPANGRLPAAASHVGLLSSQDAHAST
jgi:hypothetical protein